MFGYESCDRIHLISERDQQTEQPLMRYDTPNFKDLTKWMR